MNNIDKKQHEELINILEELIHTIQILRVDSKKYLLYQNEEEAISWLAFLKTHTDKEELKSLEIEIADRFYMRFDVQICKVELDKIRTSLMRQYIFKSNQYLK